MNRYKFMQGLNSKTGAFRKGAQAHIKTECRERSMETETHHCDGRICGIAATGE